MINTYTFVIVAKEDKIPTVYTSFGNNMIEAIAHVYKRFYVAFHSASPSTPHQVLSSALSKKFLHLTSYSVADAQTGRIQVFNRETQPVTVFGKEEMGEFFVCADNKISLETYFEFLASGLSQFKTELRENKF